MVLYFVGFKDHYSIYPATARLTDLLGAGIKARLHGKATIRFTYDEAVSTRLIARIAKARAAETADALKAKQNLAKKPAAKKVKAKPSSAVKS